MYRPIFGFAKHSYPAELREVLAHEADFLAREASVSRARCREGTVPGLAFCYPPSKWQDPAPLARAAPLARRGSVRRLFPATQADIVRTSKGENMKIAKQTALTLLAASAAITAHAGTDDYNKTVTHVGTQQQATAYFLVNEGWSQPCASGVMYLDLSTAAGKGMLGTLLTAKATGATIHWVNYTIGTGNICTATLIELN